MSESLIPWFYVWSPRYEIFHRILQFQLQNLKTLQLNPIFVEQSIFTRKVEAGKHFLGGIGIKIFVLLQELRKRPGDYLIFSDADLLVQKEQLERVLPRYKKNLITCMRDNVGSDIYNIGFMLVKSTPDTIELFESVLKRIMKEKLLDQDVFNEEVSHWIWKDGVGFFSDAEFLQSNMMSHYSNLDDFCVIQALSSQNDYQDILAEKLDTILGFYDISTLRHLLEESVQRKLCAQAKKNHPTDAAAFWFTDPLVSEGLPGADESS